MNKKMILILGLALMIFAVTAYLIMTRDTLALDTAIREFSYGLRNEGLTVIFKLLTYMGNWQTITILCILFLLLKALRKNFGFPLAATAIITTIIQKTLKISFHRQRPDVALHLIHQGGFSFPSGHSMTSMVFYGMLIFLCRRYIKNKRISNTLTALLSLLILLIGYSRIYLGVHYPTDVIGGWSIGISLLIVLTFGVKILYKRRNRFS